MERPGFFFCICPDAALMRSWMERELLEPLKNAGGAGGLLGASAPSSAPDVQTWWADEGLDRRFWDALTLLAMDGRTRVLVVRGAHQLPADVWKKLSSALAPPRPGILPVFCLECPWEKGQPKLPAHVAKLKCLAFAEKQKWQWRSAGLEPRSLRQYVQREAAARKLCMSPEALNTLSEMLIPDASAVSGVLEQLSLASADGAVDVALVRQMTEFTPDAVIFDFIREEAGTAILKAQVDKIIRRMEEQKGIRIQIADFAYNSLKEAALFDLSNGGRGVGNQVEALLINPLSRWLFDNAVIGDADVTIEHFDVGAKPPCVRCHVGKEAADNE